MAEGISKSRFWKNHFFCEDIFKITPYPLMELIMTHKELRELGVSEYRIKQLRRAQRDLPNINELVYQTSQEELTTYNLGGLSDEDILIRFQNQEEFDNINDFLKATIANVYMEREVIEQTGRTLNFIQNIQDVQTALPDYTPNDILNMTRQDLIGALQARYKEITGYWYQDGSDPAILIDMINSAT